MTPLENDPMSRPHTTALPGSGTSGSDRADLAVSRLRLGAARIDTHHHVVPPFYRDWLQSRGLDAGGLPIPDWAPRASLGLMRRTRTATAILSVSPPPGSNRPAERRPPRSRGI